MVLCRREASHWRCPRSSGCAPERRARLLAGRAGCQHLQAQGPVWHGSVGALWGSLVVSRQCGRLCGGRRAGAGMLGTRGLAQPVLAGQRPAARAPRAAAAWQPCAARSGDPSWPSPPARAQHTRTATPRASACTPSKMGTGDERSHILHSGCPPAASEPTRGQAAVMRTLAAVMRSSHWRSERAPPEGVAEKQHACCLVQRVTPLLVVPTGRGRTCCW